MARRPHSSVSKLFLATAIFFICVTTPAWSEEPQRGDESFDQFARSWMDTVNELGVPAQPAVMIDDPAVGNGNGVVTVRKYGNNFTTETREVGREGAEFVGILHYNESIYNCRENNIENCSKPSTAPVTEIFRYDDGRWVY